jgi:hypothetical protein
MNNYLELELPGQVRNGDDRCIKSNHDQGGFNATFQMK